jgi:hypothetical protein
MAIDKGLYQAPVGLEQVLAADEEPALEIEIEDPESVEIGIDGQPILALKKVRKKITSMRTLPRYYQKTY